jgi:hypothetical protein
LGWIHEGLATEDRHHHAKHCHLLVRIRPTLHLVSCQRLTESKVFI